MCLLSSSRFVLRSAIFGAALRDHLSFATSSREDSGSAATEELSLLPVKRQNREEHHNRENRQDNQE